MIHKIVIRPSISYGNLLFICSFSDPLTGELLSIVDNAMGGEFKRGELGLKQPAKAIDFSINPNNPNSVQYEFSFDDDKQGKAPYEIYKKFWLNHPNVKPPAGEHNPNFKGASILTMYDMSMQESNDAEMIRKKNKVYTKVASLDAEGGLSNKRNAAYYFGVANADKLDADGLLKKLADYNTGILMQPTNIDKFLAYDSGDFFTQLSINSRRAIEKGIVEVRNHEGKDTYFVNNHPIADSQEGVITYLDNNRDFYSRFIVEELGDKALAEKEAKRKFIAEKIEVTDETALRAKAKGLFDQLKALGVKGAAVSRWSQIQDMGKLNEAIADAEKTIKEREARKEGVIEVAA